MFISKYKQISKTDPHAIAEYIQMLFDQNQFEEIHELDQTLIIKKAEQDPTKRGKVQFFSFAEENKIAEWLNEDNYETLETFRCQDGYIVVCWEYVYNDEDGYEGRPDRTVLLVIGLVALGVLGGLIALWDFIERLIFNM